MLLLFGKCSLDTRLRELRRGQELISTEPQVFDLLVYLIRHRERVVSKEEIVEAVWGGRTVSGSTLSSRICFVRRAIGDRGSQQRFVRTFPRKGLRFVGDVRERLEIEPALIRADRSLDSGRALPETTSIAVLPFTNLSGASDQDLFIDGLVEDIADALSRFHLLSVVARGSTAAYADLPDVKRAGRELGVLYVLQGSVRMVDGLARIAV